MASKLLTIVAWITSLACVVLSGYELQQRLAFRFSSFVVATFQQDPAHPEVLSADFTSEVDGRYWVWFDDERAPVHPTTAGESRVHRVQAARPVVSVATPFGPISDIEQVERGWSNGPMTEFPTERGTRYAVRLTTVGQQPSADVVARLSVQIHPDITTREYFRRFGHLVGCGLFACFAIVSGLVALRAFRRTDWHFRLAADDALTNDDLDEVTRDRWNWNG